MVSIFGKKKPPALCEAIRKSFEEEDEEERREKLAKAVGYLKGLCCGDGEEEPDVEDIDEVLDEMLGQDIFPLLLAHFPDTDLQVNKFTVLIFNTLIQRKRDNDFPLVSWIWRNPTFLSRLTDGYTHHSTAVLCGAMLQACIAHPSLASILLNSDSFYRYFEFVQSTEYNIASDAFETFQCLLLKHEDITDRFLVQFYEPFMIAYRQLLNPENYLVLREALSLLGELLPKQPHFAQLFMADVENLKTIMRFLTDKHTKLQVAAFHVFKMFAAHMSKTQPVLDILVKNRDKLIQFVHNFHPTENEDPRFVEDKSFILEKLKRMDREVAQPSRFVRSRSESGLITPGSSRSVSMDFPRTLANGRREYGTPGGSAVKDPARRGTASTADLASAQERSKLERAARARMTPEDADPAALANGGRRRSNSKSRRKHAEKRKSQRHAKRSQAAAAAASAAAAAAADPSSAHHHHVKHHEHHHTGETHHVHTHQAHAHAPHGKDKGKDKARDDDAKRRRRHVTQRHRNSADAPRQQQQAASQSMYSAYSYSYSSFSYSYSYSDAPPPPSPGLRARSGASAGAAEPVPLQRAAISDPTSSSSPRSKRSSQPKRAPLSVQIPSRTEAPAEAPLKTPTTAPVTTPKRVTVLQGTAPAPADPSPLSNFSETPKSNRAPSPSLSFSDSG